MELENRELCSQVYDKLVKSPAFRTELLSLLAKYETSEEKPKYIWDTPKKEPILNHLNKAL
jgi:hypothetical protein